MKGFAPGIVLNLTQANSEMAQPYKNENLFKLSSYKPTFQKCKSKLYHIWNPGEAKLPKMECFRQLGRAASRNGDLVSYKAQSCQQRNLSTYFLIPF